LRKKISQLLGFELDFIPIPHITPHIPTTKTLPYDVFVQYGDLQTTYFTEREKEELNFLHSQYSNGILSFEDYMSNRKLYSQKIRHFYFK